MSSILPISSSARSAKAVGEPFLKFHLSAAIAAAFPMTVVQEVLTIPTQRLTPIPNMPTPLLGLINWRSRVLWVTDLGQFIGSAAFDATVRHYTLIILRTASGWISVVVQQVDGMIWVPPTSLQSPLVSPATTVSPYLSGYIRLPEQTGAVLALDAEAILQSPLLHPRASSTPSTDSAAGSI